MSVTADRQQLVDEINQRADCRAFLTHLRSLENYLHPAAMVEAGGPAVGIGDHDNVPELLAQMTWATRGGSSWEWLSRRNKSRLRNQVKRWLNGDVVDHMTPARLAERDPEGDVVRWLDTIGHLASP